MKINILGNSISMALCRTYYMRPGFPVFFIFCLVANFGISGCCTSSPFAMYTVINLAYSKRVIVSLTYLVCVCVGSR